MIIWFTGLSGSGKTVYAYYLKKKYDFIVLDGDELRATINSDLGYTIRDKTENGRRMIELCKLLKDYNICVPTIIGQEWGRQWAKSELKKYNFKMIWIKCSFDECRKRDPKGIYKKLPKNFVGKDYRWEDPKEYDLCIDTEINTIKQGYKLIDDFIK